MQVICTKDARMMIYEFEYRVRSRDAYSMFGRVWKPALDWFRLSERPGIDWDASWPLKTPLGTILISSFFTTFSSFVLSMLVAFNLYFRVPLLLMYDTMC